MQSEEVAFVEIGKREHAVRADESILSAWTGVEPDTAPPVVCGMGSCYACVVKRNGEEQVRACITQVQDGDSYDC